MLNRIDLYPRTVSAILIFLSGAICGIPFLTEAFGLGPLIGFSIAQGVFIRRLCSVRGCRLTEATGLAIAFGLGMQLSGFQWIIPMIRQVYPQPAWASIPLVGLAWVIQIWSVVFTFLAIGFVIIKVRLSFPKLETSSLSFLTVVVSH